MAFEIENGVLEKYIEEHGVTEIVIPDGITSIGSGAFEYCRNLTSVVIPDSVTIIEAWAFSGCRSLTSVVIPDSVTIIGYEAFLECESLTSVVIPDSVTIIEAWAFSGCRSLTSLAIPDSVTSIGALAFLWCQEIEELNIFGYSIDGRQCDISGSNWSDIRLALENKDYDAIKDRNTKFQLVAQVFLKDRQPEVENCIKKNIDEIMPYFIDIDNYEVVKGLLEFVTEQNIVKFVDNAIDHTQKGGDMQIQLLLMNYKNDKFPYVDPFDNI